MPCTGRFAPSPTGELHFGSFVTALASYLSARAQGGRWLVRIEDIDPPREQPGAADSILRQLTHFDLHWDGEVIRQSQRHAAYREVLDRLRYQNKSYFCTCSRQQIMHSGGYYTGVCRLQNRAAKQAAQRLYQRHPRYHFTDKLRGEIAVPAKLAEEDFIIHRRDNQFAYNLAVVVDDHYQGVSEVVRGADLLQPTIRQIALYQQLGLPEPTWLHVPLVLDKHGRKLSKQQHAPPLQLGDRRHVLINALRFLGQPIASRWQDYTYAQLLTQAVVCWTYREIPLQSRTHDV